jgi:hypothetical protein
MARRKSVTIEVWDNGGKTFDRYTIAISGLQEYNGTPYTYYMGASENPYSPQGFGQHSRELTTAEYKAQRGGFWQLGKRVRVYDLPKPVQRMIANELMPED